MQQAFFPQPTCLWVPYHHPQTESSLLPSSLTRCCSHKALPSFPPLAVPCLKALPSHFISSALSLPGELFNSSSFTVSHTCCLLAPVKRGKFPGCCCLLAALPNTMWGLRHVLRLTRRPVPAASRLCLAQATLSACLHLSCWGWHCRTPGVQAPAPVRPHLGLVGHELCPTLSGSCGRLALFTWALSTAKGAGSWFPDRCLHRRKHFKETKCSLIL